MQSVLLLKLYENLYFVIILSFFFLRPIVIVTILVGQRWSAKVGDWGGADNEHVFYQCPSNFGRVNIAKFLLLFNKKSKCPLH